MKLFGWVFMTLLFLVILVVLVLMLPPMMWASNLDHGVTIMVLVLLANSALSTLAGLLKGIGDALDELAR